MFSFAKIVGLLIEPYNLALLLVFCAMVMRLLRRRARLRRALVIAAGVLVGVFAFGPVANALLYPLETHHPRPASLPQNPGAVIMLGGSTREPRENPNFYEFTESADRFVEGVRLAHRYPGAVLVITGGSSAVIDRWYREADILSSLAGELGLPASRLRVDRDSRNTRENAVQTRRLLAGVKGPWILVTSAAHMPRAVACFARVGVKVVPWPVDYLRTGSGPGSWIPRPRTLGRSNAALHEYFGWLYYWLSDYV